jgi:uncharacterized protein YndB with AHSA1/START domain
MMSDAFIIVAREIFIAASPETVFRFFVDPAPMARWIGQQHTLDPRRGGIFRIAVAADATATGNYTEVTPCRRIAFTWGSEGRDDLPPGGSLVEIELEARDGGTLARLRHSGPRTGRARRSRPENMESAGCTTSDGSHSSSQLPSPAERRTP